MQSLLYAFLDELLFVFSTEMFVVRELELCVIDREGWELRATGCGVARSAVLGGSAFALHC